MMAYWAQEMKDYKLERVSYAWNRRTRSWNPFNGYLPKVASPFSTAMKIISFIFTSKTLILEPKLVQMQFHYFIFQGFPELKKQKKLKIEFFR